MKLYSIRPFLICCLSVFISTSSFAQTTLSAQDRKESKDASETKTLFKGGVSPKIKSFGLSFAPIVQFGQLGPQQGGILALHLNNKWEIGASFLGSMRHRNEIYSNDLRQNFSALSLAYTPNANKLVHLSFPLMIGVIRYQDDAILASMPGPGGRFDNFYWRNGRNAFGIQPGINAELNVHKYIRLFAGANYRLAVGNDELPELSGLSGQIGLKVGFFNQKISKK
ncbi:hypothetical protein [Aquirufa nivalisilvae]|uniref:hypothetical protein n=1 Tax=Aquirufa nivalisilvae TaxID=2516557 RepID=UPI00103298C0|nr:hypothetical protein [Aquirufa nivalisilvae]TBH75927.1 hypothetical protein EWU22_05095 [Aquirufa nivalisilvae]